MNLAKLYKYTTKGQVQSWQIFYEENYYWTEEGINTITTSAPTYCTGKNIGKANETTPEQQAELEAKAKFQKKLDKGYNTILTHEKKFFEPMLAHEIDKGQKLLFTVPTFIQPKLDGVRCYMNNKTLTTRTGKEIVSCPHLTQWPYYALDGELYNHDLKDDFNKIISLTRKTKPTFDDLQESKKLIQYWIYDYPYMGDKVFSDRYARLKADSKLFPDYFKIVPTYQIKDMDELQQYHEDFIAQGYEGSIIRLDLGSYENKRSKQLLKYKDWKEDDFEAVEVLEGKGNRKGCANMIVIKLPTGVLCNATLSGSEEFMQEVWKNKDKIPGKLISTKYFGYTEDGNLRFPVAKAIRDYE